MEGEREGVFQARFFFFSSYSRYTNLSQLQIQFCKVYRHPQCSLLMKCECSAVYFVPSGLRDWGWGDHKCVDHENRTPFDGDGGNRVLRCRLTWRNTSGSSVVLVLVDSAEDGSRVDSVSVRGKNSGESIPNPEPN